MTPEDLNDKQKYTLLHEVDLSAIKEFLQNENKKTSLVYKVFLGFLFISIFLLSFIIAYNIAKWNKPDLLQIIIAVVFSFTLLVIIHELIHAVAYKLLGVPKVSFGMNIRKFIFYAAADQFVLSAKQYIILALAPFLTILIICISGSFLIPEYRPFFIVVFSLHNFFCSGDFAFINIILQQKDWKNIYTYDNLVENKMYFYSKF